MILQVEKFEVTNLQLGKSWVTIRHVETQDDLNSLRDPPVAYNSSNISVTSNYRL